MITAFLIWLCLLSIGTLSGVLFFKYLSPKETKDLKSQRDRLFKEVEKLIKKENYLEVIEVFDQIAEISEKLGDTAVVEEFQERANTLREALGQEVKIDTTDSTEKINLFLMDLMKGPFGENQVIQLTHIVSAAASPQISAPPTPAAVPAAAPAVIIEPAPKSLLEEGAEILARLKKFKGEESEEEAIPAAAILSAEPLSSATPPSDPPRILSSAPPMPPSAVPPAVPPRAVSPPPPMPPSAVPPAAPPSVTPVAFPVPEMASDQVEIIEEGDEPQIQGMEAFMGVEPEIQTTDLKKKGAKKDEKTEISERLEAELPYLPDKLKKNIIKELLKRPAGKLRETWFQVYIHKNKKYATPQ